MFKFSTVGGRNVLPNKELQAYVLTLNLSQVLLQHSRVHVYIYAFLIRDKRILKQTNKSAFSRKYYATLLQRRLNFSQYRFFIHKKQVVRLNFLFQPVTFKRAEVKRADSREPTFYLNYKLIIYGKFCDKLIWLLNETTTFEYWKK